MTAPWNLSRCSRFVADLLRGSTSLTLMYTRRRHRLAFTSCCPLSLARKSPRHIGRWLEINSESRDQSSRNEIKSPRRVQHRTLAMLAPAPYLFRSPTHTRRVTVAESAPGAPARETARCSV